jgi:hypothetical protein
MNSKEIIRAWGENPEEILTKDPLLRGNSLSPQIKRRTIRYQSWLKRLKQLIKKEVSE